MLRQSLRGSGIQGRRGVTLAEVVIVTLIVSFGLLLLLARMPRGREDSRALTCRANLSQIGQAIAYYAQANGHFPIINTWGTGDAGRETSALWHTRAALDIKDFAGVAAELKAKKPGGTATPLPPVPRGLRCPSDRQLTPLTASNYRSNAGNDIQGSNGPFAIGRGASPKLVEAADGLGFTAAFAERMIGNGESVEKAVNYVSETDCESLSRLLKSGGTSKGPWLGDAGHDWTRGDWSQTLYQHGLPPNARVSAVANAGRCGAMGASSAHPGQVHVLLLDGSAKPWRDTVDASVWNRLGSFTDGTAKSP